MFLRLSICISLVMCRMVLGTPFIPIADKIEKAPLTPTKKWTDMTYYKKAEYVPNYVEYDNEESPIFKDGLSDKTIQPTDRRYLLEENNNHWAPESESEFLTLNENKEIGNGVVGENNSILLNEAVSTNQQVTNINIGNHDTSIDDNKQQSSDSSLASSTLDNANTKEYEQDITSNQELDTIHKTNDTRGNSKNEELYNTSQASNIPAYSNNEKSDSNSKSKLETDTQPEVYSYVYPTKSTSNSPLNDIDKQPVRNTNSQPLNNIEVNTINQPANATEKDTSTQLVKGAIINPVSNMDLAQPMNNMNLAQSTNNMPLVQPANSAHLPKPVNGTSLPQPVNNIDLAGSVRRQPVSSMATQSLGNTSEQSVNIANITLKKYGDSTLENSPQMEFNSSIPFSTPEHSPPAVEETNQRPVITLPAVLPVDNENLAAPLKLEHMVSNEQTYKSLIEEQIIRGERLLRKLEAAHHSGTKANPVNNSHHLENTTNTENKEYDAKNNITESSHSIIDLKELDSVTQILQQQVPAQTAQQEYNKEEQMNDLINQYSKQQQQQQQINPIEKEAIVKNIALENKIFRLIQANESSVVQTSYTKSGLLPISTTSLVTQSVSNEDGTILFDPSNKIKLPNGNWTPSCKNVSNGFYCLKPDGEGSIMIQCSGENVGFQFTCGNRMMCYSVGPYDVDCQNENQQSQ